jgi:RNA polymerase sigma-70 factor (ECF subfamily)
MEISGMGFEEAEINGGPGILVTAGGRAIAVVTLTIADGRITAIQFLMNPDKLSAISVGRTLPL